jgi:hypothetical protein
MNQIREKKLNYLQQKLYPKYNIRITNKFGKELIDEILEKFTILYLDDKNHYPLYKLHLNYMVIAKMIQNNEPI